MNNNYAPQGTYTVGDILVWNSKFNYIHRNGDLVKVVKVIPYGDVMDLYKVVFDDQTTNDANPISALSNDLVTTDEWDAATESDESEFVTA